MDHLSRYPRALLIRALLLEPARILHAGILARNIYSSHGTMPAISAAAGLTTRTHSANIGVERYLSPVSGNNATMTFPAFSGLAASRAAACAAAPDEMPTSSPS